MDTVTMEYKRLTELEGSLLKNLLKESYSDCADMYSARGVRIYSSNNEEDSFILMEFKQSVYGNTYYNKAKRILLLFLYIFSC